MSDPVQNGLDAMRRATCEALERAPGAGSGDPVVTVAAPGRVNLIGEHTDYNDGYVLPAAIDRWVVMSGRRWGGSEVWVRALDRQEEARFSLDGLSPDRAGELPDWARYVAGTLWSLQLEGFQLEGMALAFTGSVPQGMGLSSSAALEVATGQLALTLHQAELAPLRLAQAAQQAENQFVGVACGIMDQFTAPWGSGARPPPGLPEPGVSGPPHSRNPYLLRRSPAPRADFGRIGVQPPAPGVRGRRPASSPGQAGRESAAGCDLR